MWVVNLSKGLQRPRALVSGVLLTLALCACQSPSDHADQAYANHRLAFQQGQMDTAQAAILTAIAARDDVSEYWLALGRTQVQRGDLNGAFSAYQRAAELDPRSVEAIQALGEIALLARNFDEADRYADQLVTLDPRSLGGVALKGFVAHETGRASDATRFANAAMAINPEDEASVILKAKTLAAANDHAAGVDLIERHMSIHGETAGLLGELKTQYAATGNSVSLGRTFSRLVALRPDDFDLRLDYATYLLDREKGATALAMLGSGLSTHRLDPSKSDRIVAVLEKAGQSQVTEGDVGRLARAFEGPAKIPIARYAVSAGHDSVADHILKPFLSGAIDAGNADAMAVHAMLMERRRQPDVALDQAQRVLRFDSANQTALRVRGRRLLANGDTQQALRDALKLVDDQPEVSENRLLLARVYARRGQNSLAARWYQSAYKADSVNLNLAKEYLAFLTSIDDQETARWLTRDLDKRRATQADSASAATLSLQAGNDGTV